MQKLYRQTKLFSYKQFPLYYLPLTSGQGVVGCGVEGVVGLGGRSVDTRNTFKIEQRSQSVSAFTHNALKTYIFTKS